MILHRNAKLGPAGRFALVQAIEQGMSMKAAAAAFHVSPATAHRWWHRWQPASEDARQTLACLRDRSSRPHRSPRELAGAFQERICACRRETGWGPRLVAAATGFAHSTVWKVLHRAGLSRRPRAVREPANSYEWPCPGDLLHMDVSRYARSSAPGTRSPAITARAQPTSEQGAATTSRTRSSTTTPGSPTSSCTPTSGRSPSSSGTSRARTIGGQVLH